MLGGGSGGDGGASSALHEMSHALLLRRPVVESVNAAVVERGENVVAMLTDLKRAAADIHAARWGNAQQDLRTQHARAELADWQLLHANAELLALIKVGFLAWKVQLEQGARP